MWRVNKGDHELWIFGTLSPLPKKMQWDSRSVAAVLADTQEVIYAPYIKVTANPLKGVFALPLLWGLQNNPDKEKLRDILPDELYQRWSFLKELYIGTDRKIERHRPIFAAYELYAKAIDKSGLESGSIIYKTIRKLVKINKIPITQIGITRTIENPRALIKDFKRSSIDDIECFRKTIERLEVDLDAMRSRALAWSSGDMAALEALPYDDQSISCFEAVINSSFGSDLANASGLVDFEEQLKEKWVEAAKNALDTNTVSFAILPIAELLKPNGYVSYFRQNGYEVKGHFTLAP